MLRICKQLLLNNLFSHGCSTKSQQILKRIKNCYRKIQICVSLCTILCQRIQFFSAISHSNHFNLFSRIPSHPIPVAAKPKLNVQKTSILHTERLIYIWLRMRDRRDDFSKSSKTDHLTGFFITNFINNACIFRSCYCLFSISIRTLRLRWKSIIGLI